MSPSFFLALLLQWSLFMESYIAINPYKPFIFNNWQQYSESGRECGKQKNSNYFAIDKPESTNPKFQSLRQKHGREHCNSCLYFLRVLTVRWKRVLNQCSTVSGVIIVSLLLIHTNSTLIVLAASQCMINSVCCTYSYCLLTNNFSIRNMQRKDY